MKGDCAVIEHPIDLYYLTGLSLSRGMLLVTAQESVLFVDGRYLAKAQKEAPCPVQLWEGDAPIRWLQENHSKTIEFDSAKTSYEEFTHLQKKLGNIELIPTPSLLKRQRGVKRPDEIAALRRAADVTWKGYKHIAGLLKEGVSEKELAMEFEFFVRKAGASELSFPPIIAFGENSAFPHYPAGEAKLKKNQIVLMDLGAVVDQYRGDLTRVHFFGKVDPELENMLAWTQQAQKAAIDAVRPGTPISELNRLARGVFAEHGVLDLFVHGLGHGVGLEIHEFPSLKVDSPDQTVLLEPGMVFTIEPGLYRPGLGGVRWEDMVLVTSNGSEKLFPS